MKRFFYRKKIFRGVSLLLFFSILATSVPFMHAYATNSEKMADLEDEKKKTEEELKKANETVDKLEDSQTGLKKDLTSYSSKLDSVKQNIQKLHKDITAKEAEIARTREELEVAKAREAKQYADMKTRIKYMYENGNSHAMEAILKADSFQDFLNRTDYVKSMMEYDRNMLAAFTETKEAIAETESRLEKEQASLAASQDKAQAEESRLADLIANTQNGIEKYAEDIAAAEARAKAYEKKLIEQENQIENLKALIAQQKALVNGTTKVGKFTYHEITQLARNSTDLQIMAAIIECEAGGEPYVGKIAVGSVVMNRVRSDKFPNTIIEVIHQKSQFTPVKSGRFAIVLARGANAECTRAAQEVLNGANNINALFFRMDNGLIDGTIIGNHVFY